MTYVYIPHWLLSVLLLVLPGFWLTKRWMTQRRPALACPACGYDLRGTPGSECPECGAASGKREADA